MITAFYQWRNFANPGFREILQTKFQPQLISPSEPEAARPEVSRHTDKDQSK